MLFSGLPLGLHLHVKPTKIQKKTKKSENQDIKKQPQLLDTVSDAERAGFEPAEPFRGSHAFQACQFSHSCISPIVFGFVFPDSKVRKKTNRKIYSLISPIKLLFSRSLISS